jgi:hypothetical protein
MSVGSVPLGGAGRPFSQTPMDVRPFRVKKDIGKAFIATKRKRRGEI